MGPKDSTVELQRYRVLAQDATDYPKAVPGHATVQDATDTLETLSGREDVPDISNSHSINQPLLANSGGTAGAPIKRKSVHSDDSRDSLPNSHSLGTSMSSSRDEPPVIEAGDDHNEGTADLALMGWPVSAVNPGQYRQSEILETSIYVLWLL